MQSEQLLTSIDASCSAHSHATFAILLYLPLDPTHAPTPAPLISPGQPSGSPMESCPRPVLPHAVQAPSDTFPADSSCLVPLRGMPDSLQHAIHHSLRDSQHDTKAIGRDLTTFTATDTSQNPSLHPVDSLEPSGPHPPIATLPVLPGAPHPPSNQPHGQVLLPMLSSISDHQTCPRLSRSPDKPIKPLAELQQDAAETEPNVTANTDAMLPSSSKKPAEQPSSRPGGKEQVGEGQLTKGQLRERQLRGSELTGHKLADKAEQQQQRTVIDSEQQLQQATPRWSSDTSGSPKNDLAAQPASLVMEAMPVSPSPQQSADPASTVASPQKSRQAVVLNPGPTSPDSTVIRAGDAMANSGILRQSSTLRQVWPCTDKPPTQGKGPEAGKGSLDPAASLSKLKLPEAAASSPAASKGATTTRNLDDATATNPLPSEPAEQPLDTRAPVSTKGASTAADASQLLADSHEAGGTLPKEQPHTLSQAPAQAQLVSQALVQSGTQSMPRQKKRIYRQPSAATAEASPEAKRLKQEVQVKSEPPSPGPQQQQQPPQQQQAKDPTAAQPRKVREPIRHPEQPIDLPPSAVQNIFRSIQKLRLQGSSSPLTSQHMDLMTHLLPLLQLRVLSKYASEVLPHGNVVKFFSLTMDAMSRRSSDTKWLTQRESSAKAYRLCDAAVSLCGRLEARGMLPVKTIPTKTPQLVPPELQAAYVLCIGGYCGCLSRREFADQLMVGLLGQVCIFLEEHKASEADCKTAVVNLKAAGGSPGKVQERLRQSSATHSKPQRAQHATRASDPRQLDIKTVVRRCLDGMMRLKRVHEGPIDDRSTDLLQKQDCLWQLKIVSYFSCNLRATANASAFLTSVCKYNRNEKQNSKLDWLRHTGQQLHHQTQSALSQAHKAGILARGKDLPAKIAVLPKNLHYAAACYAIGAKSPDSSSDHAAAAVEDFVRFAQGLIHKVDPAAVPNFSRPKPDSASQSAAHSASRAAPQSPRDKKHDKAAGRHSNQCSPAAGAHSAPTDPRTRPPSQPPHPHAPGPQHSRSSGRDQQHKPHQGNYPRHCKYFYRIEGACTNSNCDHYHGSHQEYVAYMTHCGLVPYSLKFASDVGRDKWIVDAAVDGLNDMILSQQLLRGSFGQCELRPLAFLQDPSGEHARLQLQVSLSETAEQVTCCMLFGRLFLVCMKHASRWPTGGSSSVP